MSSISTGYREAFSSLAMVFCFCAACHGQSPESRDFRWRVSEPILEIDQDKLPESDQEWIAIKDPSIVRFDGSWHLFCTLRKNKTGAGRIRIGYTSFSDWKHAQDASWHVLDLTLGYHGAPQIFWMAREQKWYLIYQAEDQTRDLKYGPCFSTNSDISDPAKWTKPEPLYVVPEGKKAGLDYWVICDDTKAHLFFTSLNGLMWRSETPLTSFPNRGWSVPEIALRADIFEASHTYALMGSTPKYLTLVEAQGKGRRYFKAFVADKLEGPWKAFRTKKNPAFVSPVNVVNQKTSWATSYSHGEFIRAGYDEKLLVDPESLTLLFQGANDAEYRNRNYGQIPWRLGLLSAETVSDE